MTAVLQCDAETIDFFHCQEDLLESFLLGEVVTKEDEAFSISNAITSPLSEKKRKAEVFAKPNGKKRKRTNFNKRSWRELEHVLLAGITMIYFAQCHSMKEAKKTADYGSKSITTAWYNVHKLYEVARVRVNELHEEELPARSPNALRKKWKDSGCRTDALGLSLEDESDLPESIQRLILFNRKYNKFCILTCSEERYQTLRQLYQNGR